MTQPAPASALALSADGGSRSLGIFDPARDHIRMVLRDVHIEASVGLHAWEQLRPQRLVVNVELWAYAPKRFRGPDAEGMIVDYDRLRDLIRTELPRRPHTPLLETIAEDVLDVCLADPRVEAARVRLEKPDIFSEAAGVGIELYRRRPQD